MSVDASLALPAEHDRPTAVARRRSPLLRPGFLLAAVYAAVLGLTAVFPWLFAHRDPNHADPIVAFRPPDLEYLFGTDQLGRDVFARFVYGGQTTLYAAVIALAISVVGGVVLGIISGYSTRFIDAAVMRIVDVFLAIPGLLLSLVVITVLGFGTVNVAIAVGIGSIPSFARITRAEVLRIRVLPYVEASRNLGGSWGRVLLRRILPNSGGPVIVLAVLELGGVILAIAALSFLGFGAKPPAAEWGSLISDGRDFLSYAWWLTALPGFAVAGLVFAINHIAKTLEERIGR